MNFDFGGEEKVVSLSPLGSVSKVHKSTRPESYTKNYKATKQWWKWEEWSSPKNNTSNSYPTPNGQPKNICIQVTLYELSKLNL